METKQTIRREMLARRRALAASYIEQCSSGVCRALEEKAKSFGANTKIAAYLAFDGEISLDSFLRKIASQGKAKIFVPRWNSIGKSYELAELGKDEAVHPEEIPSGHYSVREPVGEKNSISPREIDIWLVPGVAFDKSFARLGYGGGFYDKFLSEAKSSALKIGIAYPFQIIEKVPCKPHDIKLDEIIT